MKRLILIGLFAGLFVPAGLHAQKVYKENDMVILDMSVPAGMPPGAVTTSEKNFVGYPPTYNNFLSGDAQNGTVSNENNVTVYHKLEIAKIDCSAGADWVIAFNDCLNWDHNGTSKWRLPTQRELYMMYIFKHPLETLCGTEFSAEEYWSGTEYFRNPNSAHMLDFSDGGLATGDKLKTEIYRVRCVREIDAVQP